MAETINTRKAERRALRLADLDALEDELDRIGEAHEAGTLRHAGNWTPGQVLEHVSILWRCALDGFPASAPWPIRLLGRTILKPIALRGGSAPAGVKIPSSASFLRPADGRGFEEGMGAIRAEVARTRAGERFSHPSPLFGPLTHEQWLILQLGHCSLHLGFLHPGPAAGRPAGG